MGKQPFCIGENKGADQLRGYREVTAKLICAFVFATQIVQFLLYLTPGIQASSLLLCLYSSVCVGPVGKPHCWLSHEAAHWNTYLSIKTSCMLHDVSQYHCIKQEYNDGFTGLQIECLKYRTVLQRCYSGV